MTTEFQDNKMTQVKLISTSSPDLIGDIAYMARVSNPANQSNELTSRKLVEYLIKHKHWSPFEMCGITMEINTTRDIAHQIVRHRSFAFQEFSQRYADPADMGYPFELRECRLQDAKNRQNSVETDDSLLHEHWIAQQKCVIDAASTAYNWALANGIAKEQARTVLPEGLTKTRLYMHGTVRSWIHFVDVRTTPGTQKEHMDIARQCAYEINPMFPLIKDFVHE
jgi:thymidylate synthase (FAD)|tara:strand:+ start:195 stop:866 length:672 start_codon:yes stop_codon:yes gene_type:complete